MSSHRHTQVFGSRMNGISVRQVRAKRMRRRDRTLLLPQVADLVCLVESRCGPAHLSIVEILLPKMAEYSTAQYESTHAEVHLSANNMIALYTLSHTIGCEKVTSSNA